MSSGELVSNRYGVWTADAEAALKARVGAAAFKKLKPKAKALAIRALDDERISAEIAEQAAKEQHRGWIGTQWLYDHATWLAGRVGHDVVAHVLHMAVGSMPFIPETDA